MNIASATRWAVSSVPAHLSARGLSVPLWAAPLLALSDLARDPARWRKTEQGAAVRAQAA
jgi:hypothetical protein